MQNLSLVRARRCAWLCRANAPGPFPAVGAAPCGRPQAFPLDGGRGHGEAVTDEGDRQILPFPISLPLGEGALVRTLGRMRGTVRL